MEDSAGPSSPTSQLSGHESMSPQLKHPSLLTRVRTNRVPSPITGRLTDSGAPGLRRAEAI